MATFKPERRRGLAEIYSDLRGQTEQRFEWIIVTDGPEEALAADIAGLRDPRVRLMGSPASHHRYKAMGKHYGGYHQKAAGVRAATAELICHVDDDNRIAPGYLKTLADTIESESLDFAICAIKTDHKVAPVLRPKPPFPVYTASGFDVLCLMIRRKFVEELGGWPEHGGAIEPIGNLGDDETLLRIIVEKGRYKIIDDVLGYHRTLKATKRRQHFVLSFPKAGRTWVRFLLGNYIRSANKVEISEAKRLEVEALTTELPNWPAIQVNHDRRCDEVPVGELARSVEAYRGENVTLIVRDPRDVLVSWFFEKTKRAAKLWGQQGASGDISAFVRSEYGIELILRWMQDWGEQLDVPGRVKFFRYEDFREDTVVRVRSLLHWLDVGGVDEEALKAAVAASSFETMKALESSGASGSKRLTPGDPNDPESFKMRRGVVGGYRDYLSAEDIAFIDEKMTAMLPACFGYTPCRDR
jgi:glycosyltransferase involved in cell wall biosynthesis